MKTTIAGLLAALFLAAATGCEKTTVQGPAGKKLTIVKPADQSLKRGEINEVLVMISRENFGGEVEISFENLPKGVHVADIRPIPSDKSRGTYTLHADPEAGLVENHQVLVTASGPDGMRATEMFGISVREKEKTPETTPTAPDNP
ncbi:MAG: hypothetical protein HYY18_01340 [Planctomycetes bacterium]|nr:hypothetical protein [Planctomycetota bacterium]